MTGSNDGKQSNLLCFDVHYLINFSILYELKGRNGKGVDWSVLHFYDVYYYFICSFFVSTKTTPRQKL